MARQPFYHRLTFIFTADRECSEEEVALALRNGLVRHLKGAVDEDGVIEEFDEPEAGDPADLD